MSIRIDGVLDIECQDWDRFIIGALKTHHETRVTRDPDELLDWLLAVDGEVWGHFGGRYDFLWALDGMRRRGLDARIHMSGSLASRIDVGSLILRDSYRLIPMSLAKMATMIGRKKLDVGLACRGHADGRDCGGYCAIRHDMPESDFRKIETYLVDGDIEILWEVLHFVQDFANAHGILLTGTTGGTAWKTAQAELGLEKAKWKERDYDLVRTGYYGGRCEAAIIDAPHVERYDLHSAYPAALANTALPIGEPKLLTRRTASIALGEGKPGVYRCGVVVPEMHAPPLPWRMPNRIAYPVGHFTGEWTLPELAHAIEVGTKIERVDWAMVWPTTEKIIAPFCERLWRLRANAGPSTALGQWLKWILNSFSGKVAQDPLMRRYVMGDAPQLCPGPSRPCDKRCSPRRCCPHQCSGLCGAWEAIDPGGTLWTKPYYKIAPCSHIEWGAYLTGSNRVELHKQIIHAGDSWVYSDTDAVYSTAPLTRRLGDELGEWAHEGSLDGWRCIAPKSYMGTDPDTGKVIAKCKGLARITPERWEQYARGEPVAIDDGVSTLLRAARAGDSWFTRRDMSRASRADGLWCGSRMVVGARTHAVDTSILLAELA